MTWELTDCSDCDKVVTATDCPSADDHPPHAPGVGNGQHLSWQGRGVPPRRCARPQAAAQRAARGVGR